MFHHISSIPERREKRRDYDHDETSFAWKPETVLRLHITELDSLSVTSALPSGRDDLSSSRSPVTTFR